MRQPVLALIVCEMRRPRDDIQYPRHPHLSLLKLILRRSCAFQGDLEAVAACRESLNLQADLHERLMKLLDPCTALPRCLNNISRCRERGNVADQVRELLDPVQLGAQS